MKNEESIIKLLIKIVIGIIIIILVTIILIYNSSTWDMKILNNNSSNTSSNAPSQLKWYDSFKGVNNLKGNKTQEKGTEQPKSFLQYEIEKNNNK